LAPLLSHEENVMAAFLTDRLLSPRTVPAVGAFPPIPGVIRRRSLDHFAAITALLRASVEWLLLLWMLAVIAFFALIGAGAAGLLQ
jgi:hypothetical protein